MEAATQSRSLAEQREAEAEAGGEGEGGAVVHEGGEGGNGNDGAAHAADLEGEGDGEQPGKAEQAKAPGLAIEGDGQLTLTVGGETPTKATVKLRGGKIDVESGDLDKGKVVDLVVKARIVEVDFVDKTNGATGEVTETERRHVARIMSVERLKS